MKTRVFRNLGANPPTVGAAARPVCTWVPCLHHASDDTRVALHVKRVLNRRQWRTPLGNRPPQAACGQHLWDCITDRTEIRRAATPMTICHPSNHYHLTPSGVDHAHGWSHSRPGAPPCFSVLLTRIDPPHSRSNSKSAKVSPSDNFFNDSVDICLLSPQLSSYFYALSLIVFVFESRTRVLWA